ncbi:MAG: methionine adenosyltransferase [Polyangiaceae bacterium]|nr:methionine adenosyltransferase [Myxococcales bacterium]MCB9584589.1 methionine adenosyltransferase [Polyangiaceae bacterium]
MSSYLFTSESVSEGHPDKICDAVSDGVLDAALAQDPRSRVACETFIKTGFVVIGGEITTEAFINFAEVARNTIKEIGYTSSEMGFDYATCGVLVAIEPQSPDISQGVSEGEGMFTEQGAGDQGLMFGFACDETPELMPAPIMYSHALTKRLAAVRKSNKVDFLRPDSKSQVTVEYVDGKPKRIDAVVISTQHSESVQYDTLRDAVMDLVVKKTLPKNMLDSRTKYFINPTGRFVIGGPCGDAGLTGRKIIVDTYGGAGRHGGGAFSGKDPSKVDRSACYYARYVAKNIVAAGLATRAEVQVAYAIGVAQPVSVRVDTFGTAKIPEEKIEAYVRENFDMTPRGIITQLDLLKPIYSATAAYGHFGRKEFSWEKTNRAKELRALLSDKGAKVAVPAKKAAKANGAAASKKANGAAKKAAPAKNGAAKNGAAKKAAPKTTKATPKAKPAKKAGRKGARA